MNIFIMIFVAKMNTVIFLQIYQQRTHISVMKFRIFKYTFPREISESTAELSRSSRYTK